MVKMVVGSGVIQYVRNDKTAAADDISWVSITLKDLYPPPKKIKEDKVDPNADSSKVRGTRKLYEGCNRTKNGYGCVVGACCGKVTEIDGKTDFDKVALKLDIDGAGICADEADNVTATFPVTGLGFKYECSA